MIMDLYSGLIKIVVLLSIFIYSDAVLGTFGQKATSVATSKVCILQ